MRRQNSPNHHYQATEARSTKVKPPCGSTATKPCSTKGVKPQYGKKTIEPHSMKGVKSRSGSIAAEPSFQHDRGQTSMWQTRGALTGVPNWGAGAQLQVLNWGCPTRANWGTQAQGMILLIMHQRYHRWQHHLGLSGWHSWKWM